MGCRVYSKCTHTNQCGQPRHAPGKRWLHFFLLLCEHHLVFPADSLNPRGDKVEYTIFTALHIMDLLRASTTYWMPSTPQMAPKPFQLAINCWCCTNVFPFLALPYHFSCTSKPRKKATLLWNTAKWLSCEMALYPKQLHHPHTAMKTSRLALNLFMYRVLICVTPKHLNFATF